MTDDGSQVLCVLGFCKSAMDWDLGVGQKLSHSFHSGSAPGIQEQNRGHTLVTDGFGPVANASQSPQRSSRESKVCFMI